MTIVQADYLRQAILDRAHCHGNTSDYGITMPDGNKYHGPVWSLDRRLYVFYRSQPYEVVFFNVRYLAK